MTTDAIDELIAAVRDYYRHYMRDEAEAGDCCSFDQHLAAVRVQQALRWIDSTTAPTNAAQSEGGK